MKGLLLYDRKDYKRNIEFIQWMKEEGEKRNINFDLVFLQELYKTGAGIGIGLYDYDFVVNRTRDYNTAVRLELAMMPIFNRAEVTRMSQNKLAGYHYAFKRAVNFPALYSSGSVGKASTKIVSKPIDGHGGERVHFVKSEDELNVYREDWDEVLHQMYIRNHGDIRFYVIGNEIVHAVRRTPKDGLLSNYSKGGNFELFDVTPSHEKKVKRLIKHLQVDFAGIDFFLTNKNELIFNEIEDVVGSRILSVLEINNTVPLFLDHILESLKHYHY